MRKLVVRVGLGVVLGFLGTGWALAQEYYATSGVVAPTGLRDVWAVTRVDRPLLPDHLFVITEKTQIFGADGKPTNVREGDYIWERCKERWDGTFEAERIVVLTPYHETFRLH